MPPNPATQKVLCIYTGYLPVETGSSILERHEDWFGDDRDILEIPANRLGEYLLTGHFVKVKDEEDED